MVAPVGYLGFGYRVAHWEDIQQLAYETLLTTGTTLEDIESHPQPLGFIYDLCKNKGMAEAKKARAYGSDYALTGFIADDTDPYTWVKETIADRSPRPEDILIAEEFDRELRAAVLAVIAKTATKAIQEALELWVLHGHTATEIGDILDTTWGAIRERIRKGLKSLEPEEVASLHAARVYFHPQAKRPKGVEGTATPLLGLM